jgi:hypothetical protein
VAGALNSSHNAEDIENVQLIFVNLVIFMVTTVRQVRKCIHSITVLAHWL